MNLLKKFTDLVLYGNFWIAICALAFYVQTVFLLNDDFVWTPVAGLVFFSSFFLYAVHRIVGIDRLQRFVEVDRYHVIAHFRNHIRLYALITGALAAWYFLQVPWLVKLALIIPGIVSLGYVLPILGDQKRLRDLSYIKIFLIAIVWAWVTVWLPALELGVYSNAFVYLMLLERALFVFAITLPFDIRDLKVDAFSKVPTIPFRIGVQKTKWLAYFLLIIMLGITGLNYALGYYTLPTVVGMLFSVSTTAGMIFFCKPETHDYVYSGLLDGSMLFQFLLIYACNLLF